MPDKSDSPSWDSKAACGKVANVGTIPCAALMDIDGSSLRWLMCWVEAKQQDTPQGRFFLPYPNSHLWI